MLLTRRAPYHIARPDFLLRPSLALHPATPGGDYQGLPERMVVPCRSSAGLERNTEGKHARRGGRLKQRVDAYGAGEILVGSFARGLRATSFDLHFLNSSTRLLFNLQTFKNA